MGWPLFSKVHGRSAGHFSGMVACGGWRQMTAGDPPRSAIIASEPLTTDVSDWLEVPEYSMLTAELTPDGVAFETRGLDVIGVKHRFSFLKVRTTPDPPSLEAGL